MGGGPGLTLATALSCFTHAHSAGTGAVSPATPPPSQLAGPPQHNKQPQGWPFVLYALLVKLEINPLDREILNRRPFGGRTGKPVEGVFDAAERGDLLRGLWPLDEACPAVIQRELGRGKGGQE